LNKGRSVITESTLKQIEQACLDILAHLAKSSPSSSPTSTSEHPGASSSSSFSTSNNNSTHDDHDDDNRIIEGQDVALTQSMLVDLYEHQTRREDAAKVPFLSSVSIESNMSSAANNYHYCFSFFILSSSLYPLVLSVGAITDRQRCRPPRLLELSVSAIGASANADRQVNEIRADETCTEKSS
jgi:hypothetical protein